MRIYVKFKNNGRESLDFIELGHSVTGATVTLDWDTSYVENGNIEGRGVHINYDSSDETEDETYANNRLNELKGLVYVSAQAGNLDTGSERTDIEMLSITLDDDGDIYDVPIIN